MMPRNYIASPNYLTDMYSNPAFNGQWAVIKRVSIAQIKVDKSLFSYQNEVDMDEVNYMCENFHVEAWYPIMVNPNYFLLDGQHRLAAAKKMNLKYIDVVVDRGPQEVQTQTKRLHG